MENSQRRVFYLGLNMTGAISAGAYTAGVLDFLIDALDTWYAERAVQQQKYGDDFAKWEIPAHEVRLVVMSGASAGGMTAAIAAAALCEPFTPVRAVPAAGAPPANRLYQSWVSQIDLKYLLGSSDLQGSRARVESLFDSTQIDAIAQDALQVRNPLPVRRPYVADGLKLILTLTNLKGIPYAIEDNAGSAETQTLYHADQQNFQVWWDQAASSEGAIPLSPRNPANWPILQQAAKATGAFPLALRPRVLARTTTEYNRRQWKMQVPDPQPENGACECEKLQEMPPSFGTDAAISFSTLNVDGGVTNNSPFDCAYNELSQSDPKQPIGRPPTSAEDADRAVISIAPFLSAPDFSLTAELDPSMLSVAAQLADTVVNQSRIEGEVIKLTKDQDVYSAFHISPSIDQTTVHALASASFAGFGGFIAQAFRDHDYQLGRRNCQWFLQQYLALPANNVVMRQYEGRERMHHEFGMGPAGGNPGISLIPLLGGLATEITVVRTPIGRDALPPVADQALSRIKLVATKLLEQHSANFLAKAGFEAAWLFLNGKLKNALLKYAGRNLAREDLIR